MNLTIKSLVAILMLSTTACSAQKIKNQQKETVKVYGNCGMCKSTIEEAGSKKKEAKVEWNEDTKMATLYYDSLKTTKSEILKRIALSGYDNELFLAPGDVYNNLHGCCQYERTSKNESMHDPMSKMMENHSHESHRSTPMEEYGNGLKSVFDNYFALKNALIESDERQTSEMAQTLLKSMENVEMENLKMDVHVVWMEKMSALMKTLQTIAGNKDIEQQRMHFMKLSDDMYQLLKVAKYEVPVYHQFCPMANSGKGASWLSTEEEVENPYYGSLMLNCGKVLETIK